MNMQLNEPFIVVAGYVRRSSWMQKDNFSIDAQKRAITDECARRGLPAYTGRFLSRLLPFPLAPATGHLAFAPFHPLPFPLFKPLVLLCGRQ